MPRSLLCIGAVIALAPAWAQDIDLRSGEDDVLIPTNCPISLSLLPAGSACNFLRVPENYEYRSGRDRHLMIPVVQLGPTNYDHMAVVLGGGGPGGSVGINSRELAFWEELRRKVLGLDRGLLLVEQRGVAEEPLRCKEARAETEWVLSHDLSSQEEFDIYSPRMRECLARIRNSGIELGNYTTHASARDFETLRQAIGVKQLDLIAFSYSSLIAFDLMSSHPNSVHSVLLDSPLIPQDSPLPDTVFLDRLFGRLSDKCLSISSCSSTYGDMRRNLRLAIRRFELAPATIPIPAPDGSRETSMVLNSRRMLASVGYAFYQRKLIDTLPRYLHELALLGSSELTGAYAANLAEFYRLDSITDGLFYSIKCREQIPFAATGMPQTDIEWDPFFDSDRAQEFCSVIWNVGAPIKPKRIPQNGHPMLFLTGTLDWVTPEEITAQAMVDIESAQHVSVNSPHSTLTNNSCAIALAGQFMENPRLKIDHPCIGRQADNFR